jgi:hypothetical protein
MVTFSSATSTAAPEFHLGLVTATTSSQSYTGTGRLTYSRVITSDGHVRRSKQGASLPPRRQMQFTASRMCYSGDEDIVRVEQEDNISDDGYGITAVTSVSLISSISATDKIQPTSQDTTSPIKHPVQKPTKTADQHEKEYIENISALTVLD